MSSTAPAKKTTTKKSATSSVATPVVATPVVVAPVVAAPVVVATPVVVAPVVAPVVAAVTEATTATTEENVNVVTQFNSLVEKVNVMRAALGAVFSDMKKLEKQIPRELKRAQKGRRRRAAPVMEDGVERPKKETVFTKPTPISDALCTFLGVAKGSQLSRSEVTTRVCAYAKSHQLMEKQVIKADTSLRRLLSLTEKDELKILNLQRYLKPHYIKPAAPVATTTTTTPARS